MKKANLITGGILCTICAVCFSATISSSDLSSRFLNLRASNTTRWSHYSRIDPSFTDYGCNEYWISCGANHERQFTKPEIDDELIDEKGQPSNEFYASLTPGDGYYLEPYRYLYDFEDGVIPALDKNQFVRSVSVSSTDGVEGSKCLKFTVANNDFQFGLPKSFFDGVFSDPDIVSVQFDAKASSASQNFRYNTQYLVGGNPSQPFEDYAAGAGITTDWKTFYFTRDMYNYWDASSYMIKGTIGGGDVYIDNVKTSTKDPYSHVTSLGFETNTVIDKTATSTLNTLSVRIGVNVQSMEVSGAGVVTNSYGYSYSIKSEGNRSFYFTKQSGYLAVYLNRNIVNSIPGDYVLIDMYSTTGFNSYDNNKGITDGQNNPFNRATIGNNWFTLVLNKANGITTDGRILTMSGSAAGTVYFDNIRGIGAVDNFESAYGFNAGQYGYVLDYKTETTESAGNTIRDKNKNYSIMINGANLTKVEITSEKANGGHYSAKFTYSAKGYCAMFINPNLLNTYLPMGYSVAFDIWASASFTSGQLAGVSVPVGQWTTVTLTADKFEGHSTGSYNGRFSTASFNDAGTFYIDNLRLIAPAS